jgi:hypothetical protein
VTAQISLFIFFEIMFLKLQNIYSTTFISKTITD